MKSITTNPPMSLNLSWRAISSAASKFVCSAVCSMSPPLVALHELISIETKASSGRPRWSPRGKTDLALKRGFDLALDLESIKKCDGSRRA